MYASADDIGEHLGRPLTETERAQVERWLGWLEADIARRLPGAMIDAPTANRVLVESVAAYMANPSGAASVSVAVDDGSMTRRYERGCVGRVAILPELWADLGLTEGRTAFTIRPSYEPDRAW